MPRLTRRSLASKEDDQSTPAKTGQSKRGSKKAEALEEPLPIGEGPTTGKTSRSARGKGSTAKETPKGNATSASRGRGKKDESDEEMEEEVEESPAPKRGARGSRGKKEEPEPKKDTPAPKRGGRGARAKKVEQEEEEEEEEEIVSPKKPVRGGRGKKQEEETPVVKKSARGVRGKKNEQPEPEEEEEEEEEEKVEPSPASKKPAAKGRAKRGSGRTSKQEIEEEKEEPEVEEKEKTLKESPAPKGRQSRGGRASQPTPTPPSGGRRSYGRGRRGEGDGTTTEEVAAPVEAASPASSRKSVGEKSDTDAEKDSVETAAIVETVQDSDTQEEEMVEDVKKPKEEEKMEIDTDVKTTEQSEKETHVDDSNRKRKHQEDDDDVAEEESNSKKAKTTEEDVASDYVIVNKDDVPSADSKEIKDSLPPTPEAKVQETPVESKKKEDKAPVAVTEPTSNPDNSESTMAAPPSVVPLTEAELAKQYNPTIRDRDENSSMMVEVGSEAASDIGSVSRNFDMSEVAAMDVTSNADDAEGATDNVSKTDDSIEISAENTSKSGDIAQVSTLDNKAVKSDHPAIPSEPISPPAPPAQTQPASIPEMPVVPVPDVQLNSIPMPTNNVNASNCATDSLPREAQPTTLQITPVSVPSSIPPTPVIQKAATQNGNCQSAPLLTSTPAKKPVVLDSGFVSSSPSITQRKVISNTKFPIELMDPAMWFSVVSYNILADCHLRRYDYSYTDSQYLDLSYRHTVFMKEFDYLDADILCLQEVDKSYYHDILEPAMTTRGYKGVFMKRTQDWYAEGEATFVKTSKFEVLGHHGISLKDLAYGEIEMAGLTGDVARAAKKYVDRADVVLLCSLKSKKTGKCLTVANIHVCFDPKAPDLQCVQVASAVKELVTKAGSDLNPYIICGDFNSETTSPAYQLAKDGYLSDEHIRQLQNIQSMDNTEGSSHSIIHYLWKAFQHTSSNLKSAYEACVGKEPEVTSLNGLVRACLDYIFYSSSTMYAVNVLESLDPKVVDASGGLPSKDIPSDHLSMKAVFRLKD